MPKVVLAKAVRFPFDSSSVHRSGTTLEVSDAEEKRLRELGVLVEEVAAPVADEPAPKPAKPKKPVAKATAASYPTIPDPTAPVAEWKEYARVNDIKLTGLSKKNEIVGYVTKVVNAA